MQQEFKVGELVDITIRGARVAALPGVDPVALPYMEVHVGDLPHRIRIAVPAAQPAITVERVAPAEWPPQPGDVWRDSYGCVWFAVARETRNGWTDLLVPAHDSVDQLELRHSAALQQLSGPLTLVHRLSQPAAVDE